MASLQRYSVKGKTYYRVVESKRINGKPTPVPIMHIGSAEELVRRLLSPEEQTTSVRSFQHGDVAALKAIADQLGVVGVINKYVGKSKRGISVGTTMLLAAINRAVDPCSKRAWSKWANETSIPKLFEVAPEQLTSQYFWNCMDVVSPDALEAIEAELTKRVVERFNIKLDLLFFDPTNFHTYIASDNKRSELAQRGRNKQKRFDLRQISLSLLAARDGLIPLCSQVYQGNIPDVKAFPDSLSAIRKRLEAVSCNAEEITLVYDKGNNSRTNQALVDESKLHFVVSLVPSHHQDLLSVPTDLYSPMADITLPGFSAHRIKREVWGAERTILLFTSEQFRLKQIRGFEQHLNKCLSALQKWKETLSKPRTGPHSPEQASKQIEELLNQQHLKEIVAVNYNPDASGSERLTWTINEEKKHHLYNDVFGKRFLMTNRNSWSNAEILKAYNAESGFERTFSLLKNPYHLAVRPQYHWTDQKVRVHVSICLIALMLSRLLHKLARERHQYSGDVDTLLDDLGDVRLALIMRTLPSSRKGTRPHCTWTLEERDDSACDLANYFSKFGELFFNSAKSLIISLFGLSRSHQALLCSSSLTSATV